VGDVVSDLEGDVIQADGTAFQAPNRPTRRIWMGWARA
jgi:hypothetical protein